MRHLLTDLRGNPIYIMSRAARLRNRMRHPHLPALFYLVQNRAWNDVISRAKSHPHEVLVQEDGSKNTCLHVACRLDPPKEVIWALRQVARAKNAEGCTPLHIAASHRCSAPSLDVLLECASVASATEARPSAFFFHDAYKSLSPTADLSRCGRAPIHYACMSFRGLEPTAFRKLLEATLKEGNVLVDDDYYSKRLLGLDDFFNEDEEMMQSTTSFESSTKKTVNVMTMRDSSGQTPLGLLFRRYRERMRCVINTVDRLWRVHSNEPNRAALAAAIKVHAELGELWQRARFILARLTEERLDREADAGSDMATDALYLDPEPPVSPAEFAVEQEAASWAAEQHMAVPDAFPSIDKERRDESPGSRSSGKVNVDSCKESRSFRIVHASVGLIGYGCPPEMIRLAISIHPDQVREMDEDGNLPIHIAATARSYLATHCAGGSDKSTIAAAAAAAVAASDEDSLVSDATGVMSFFSSATVSQTMNAFDKVIKILLQHYPESAKIPQGKTGRLPLVMAVESGCRTWDDGIHTLLSAYPPALHNRKIMSLPLYANVLAMIADTSKGSCARGLDGSGHKTGCPRSPVRPGMRQAHVSPRKRGNRKRKDASKKLTTMFEFLKHTPDLLVSQH